MWINEINFDFKTTEELRAFVNKYRAIADLTVQPFHLDTFDPYCCGEPDDDNFVFWVVDPSYKEPYYWHCHETEWKRLKPVILQQIALKLGSECKLITLHLHDCAGMSCDENTKFIRIWKDTSDY